MVAEVLPRGVQLYTVEHEKFSFPITHSEAGFYTRDEGFEVSSDDVLSVEKAGTETDA
jgi:hypothetical protein